MIKLIALYKKPADPDAFESHYHAVHTPLVMKTPNLKQLAVTHFTASPMGGEPAYYMMAEMHYENQAMFDDAMKSPENRAVGKDLMSFAKETVTLLIGEDK
ncbi:MAG: EthD family reductase [Rhizobacter sp.]|nr:EthD family reductase [Chlorobiales bacterium]